MHFFFYAPIKLIVYAEQESSWIFIHYGLKLLVFPKTLITTNLFSITLSDKHFVATPVVSFIQSPNSNLWQSNSMCMTTLFGQLKWIRDQNLCTIVPSQENRVILRQHFERLDNKLCSFWMTFLRFFPTSSLNHTYSIYNHCTLCIITITLSFLSFRLKMK